MQKYARTPPKYFETEVFFHLGPSSRLLCGWRSMVTVAVRIILILSSYFFNSRRVWSLMHSCELYVCPPTFSSLHCQDWLFQEVSWLKHAQRGLLSWHWVLMVIVTPTIRMTATVY